MSDASKLADIIRRNYLSNYQSIYYSKKNNVKIYKTSKGYNVELYYNGIRSIPSGVQYRRASTPTNLYRIKKVGGPKTINEVIEKSIDDWLLETHTEGKRRWE